MMTSLTGSAPRILVIEDDDDSRTLLGHLLTAEGYEVAEARNGLEGLRTAWACRPDLILLDVQMPVMDGFAFRRQQMGDQALASIPVICVSALDGVSLQSRALGNVEFVRKPIDFDRLITLVGAATTVCARVGRRLAPAAIPRAS